MSFEEIVVKLRSNSVEICDEVVRLLCKIADNIIKNPNNPKVRILQKNNSTIKNKVLAANGGLECLLLMGFQETDTSLVMSLTIPTDKVVTIKNYLLNLPAAAPKEKTAAFKSQVEVSNSLMEDKAQPYDLGHVKRFVPPPYTYKFTIPFLNSIEKCFHFALAFDDKDCQSRAKSLIPLSILEIMAQKALRHLQTEMKKEKNYSLEVSTQDLLIYELLNWFKNEFFTWVDNPNCDNCNGTTEYVTNSAEPKDLVFTSRVEVFKCNNCQKETKFPRYNDLNLLLETRRGRCGEWAQVFTLMCRALGWDARYVICEQDHVWTEVYSVAQKRWLHCDPCENVCDTPLMYETGWNKKLTYIIAYSPEEVQDVTWRYSSKHKEVLSRRRSCLETELAKALVNLRTERQSQFSVTKRNYLNKRIVCELVDLMIEKQPGDKEKQGRISGSAKWRSSRGEIKSDRKCTWKIVQRHLTNNYIVVKYSSALDEYQFMKSDEITAKVQGWSLGVFEYKNIFRKEEHDWKVVYLARCEGTDQANITWKFDFHDTGKTIDVVSLKLSYKTYENGVIDIFLKSDDTLLNMPAESTELETPAFQGKQCLTITANLSGGKDDVAWQHTQLFRQPMDDQSFPFILFVTFKDST